MEWEPHIDVPESSPTLWSASRTAGLWSHADQVFFFPLERNYFPLCSPSAVKPEKGFRRPAMLLPIPRTMILCITHRTRDTNTVFLRVSQDICKCPRPLPYLNPFFPYTHVSVPPPTALCYLSNDIYDYHYVTQGKTTVPSIDDKEDFQFCDVSVEFCKNALDTFLWIPVVTRPSLRVKIILSCTFKQI